MQPSKGLHNQVVKIIVPYNRARCVLASQHAGLRRQGGGLHRLLQDRPEEGVPLDPCEPGGRAEDRHHHPLRPFRV